MLSNSSFVNTSFEACKILQFVPLGTGQKYEPKSYFLCLPFRDGKDKDIISRFDTDLNTNKTFYTDSNGRQMIKRV